MILAGVDLAWQSDKNGTALAVGALGDGKLSVVDIDANLRSLVDLQAKLEDFPALAGIAIDGPLIVRNESGQRQCEKLVSRAYGSMKASCHASNLTLYRDPAGVRLSEGLSGKGFKHLDRAPGKWQIECYPHPALIEIFGLDERLSYKKGEVSARCTGQTELAERILSLSNSSILPLYVPDNHTDRLTPSYIESLKGNALKQNEDFLDSIVCLYIAGLYATGVQHSLYGDAQTGYIYVPQQRCA